MSGIKNLVYNLLVVSVIAFAFCAFMLALTHISYASATNTITANVIVPTACYLTMNIPGINFGSVAPGVTSTYNSILYSDTAGNINTYLWVATTNWIYTSNSQFGFLYTNTLWSVNSGSGYAAMLNALPGTNTLLLIPFGSSNTLYYEVSIPPTQTAASYNSIITGQITC